MKFNDNVKIFECSHKMYFNYYRVFSSGSLSSVFPPVLLPSCDTKCGDREY